MELGTASLQGTFSEMKHITRNAQLGAATGGFISDQYLQEQVRSPYAAGGGRVAQGKDRNRGLWIANKKAQNVYCRALYV